MQIQINFIKGVIRQDHRPVNFQNPQIRLYDNKIQNTELCLVKGQYILIQGVGKDLTI
jgi:hypothetical protein